MIQNEVDLQASGKDVRPAAIRGSQGIDVKKGEAKASPFNLSQEENQAWTSSNRYIAQSSSAVASTGRSSSLTEVLE